MSFCKTCHRLIEANHYIYGCYDCKIIFCSECRKKHAGHNFLRLGKSSEIDYKINFDDKKSKHIDKHQFPHRYTTIAGDIIIRRSIIDLYSTSRICLGVAIYLLASLWLISTANLPIPENLAWFLIIMIIIPIALIWEFLENIFIWFKSYKFKSPFELIMNMIINVIISLISGFTMWIIKLILIDLLNLEFLWFFLFGIALFVPFLILNLIAHSRSFYY
ncbi:MAG: hypothetical protein ACFFAO_13410 [Candidatus Hermodarchaeota archaeon]